MAYSWGKKRPSDTSGPCVYCGKPRAREVYSAKMKTFIHKGCVSEVAKTAQTGASTRVAGAKP